MRFKFFIIGMPLLFLLFMALDIIVITNEFFKVVFVSGAIMIIALALGYMMEDLENKGGSWVEK